MAEKNNFTSFCGKVACITDDNVINAPGGGRGEEGLPFRCRMRHSGMHHRVSLSALQWSCTPEGKSSTSADYASHTQVYLSPASVIQAV